MHSSTFSSPHFFCHSSSLFPFLRHIQLSASPSMMSHILKSRLYFIARAGIRPQLPVLPSRNLIRRFATPSNVAFARFNSTKATLKVDNPQLMIAFTCKKCETRSSHVFSKQAYTKGSVLIQCPGCKGRHLIADNLKIFRDENVNLEDILKASGESVATTTDDLAFEDIPESLRKVIGHHANDAPEEYQKPEGGNLPPAEETKKE